MNRILITSLAAAVAFATAACDPDPAPIVTLDAVSDTQKDTAKDTSKPDATGQPDALPDAPPSPDADPPKPDVSPPDVPAPDTEDTGPDGPQCMADNETCLANEECCSGICTGNAAYVEGQCISPLIDGSYCEADTWCKSSSCVDSQCKSSSCTAEGATCFGHAMCCSGKCSVGANSLDPGVCVVPVGNGQSCINDNYCVSNNCDAGVCAASTCKAVDEQCNAAEDCCTGLCSFASYFGSVCVPPQPDGFSCQGPEFCESGVCDNGICGTGGTCLVEDSPCDFSCCEGLYCPSNFSTLIPGKCTPNEPDGSYCESAQWCQSGKCVNSQCQPASCTETATACTEDAECCTGICNGTCQNLVGIGTTCVLDKQCASNNCSDGTCGPAAVTFADVYNDVLVPKGCTSGYCHGAPSNDGTGLDFKTEAAAFGSLLYNVAKIPGCGMVRYVVPNNPEVSIMWHRVRPADLDGGDPCFAEKMPKGNAMGLDPASAAIVEAWISSGATM